MLFRSERSSVQIFLFLIFCMALACVGTPGSCDAGAWTRQRGEAYAKASISVLHADDMFDRSGKRSPLFDPARYQNGKYSELGAALYVEYGFRSWLTFLGTLPFKVATREADAAAFQGDLYGQEYGFGDLKVGLRAPLHRGRWVAAIEPELKVPLYSVDPNETSKPALGSGFVDGALAISVGTGIPSVRGYIQGSVGYRIRGGSTAEEVYGDFEVGAEPARALRARVRYDGVNSEGETTAATNPGMTAPVPNSGEQDVQRIAPTIAWAPGGTTEVSLTWRRVLAGANTIRSSEWEIAIAFLGPVLPR